MSNQNPVITAMKAAERQRQHDALEQKLNEILAKLVELQAAVEKKAKSKE